ncbi:MAG: UDP-N-acetylglucosamine 2-epimerase (non-hydrolyzing) [Thermoguttaceae bacterium]|nr:UDP-N-acetylglucosamine 2-epimerase (non-hydrolyzing) [Thermoguttaceae bacterium]
MKVVTIIGTRPEIIRTSRIVATLDEYAEHRVVHTGQNYDYELNQIFFDDLSLRKPDYFLNAAGASPAKTAAAIVDRVDDVYAQENPDAVVILGDSNSCLAAYAAKRRRIPIFHVEAGKRSFDQRVPEETNRRLADSLADVHMPSDSVARDNLLREGYPADRIFKIGSPAFEVFSYYRPKIEASNVLARLGLRRREYYVVAAQRAENIDNARQFEALLDTLNKLAETTGRRVVFSAHPRARKRMEALGATLHPAIALMKPLGFHDYNALQKDARTTLSDSGALDEEAAILNFPALNLRDSRESCETNDAGGSILTGVEWSRVSAALKILEKRRDSELTPPQIGEDYRTPNVSQKVAQIVVGYAEYVNRVVWRK